MNYILAALLFIFASITLKNIFDIYQKMKLKLFFGILLSLTLASFSAYGHKDTDFVIQPDGILVGFPSKYGSAKIMINNTPLNISFQIGSNHVDLPSCITKTLSEGNIKDIYSSGSWYHGNWFIRIFYPPYINIYIPDDLGYYSISFNMRNAKFIEMTKVNEIFNDKTKFTEVTFSKIRLKDICSRKEIKQLSPSKRKI